MAGAGDSLAPQPTQHPEPLSSSVPGLASSSSSCGFLLSIFPGLAHSKDEAWLLAHSCKYSKLTLPRGNRCLLLGVTCPLWEPKGLLEEKVCGAVQQSSEP